MTTSVGHMWNAIILKRWCIISGREGVALKTSINAWGAEIIDNITCDTYTIVE